MANIPLDMDTFSELIRGLLQNFDPSMLKQMVSMMDQDTLMKIIKNLLDNLDQTMKPEEVQVLNQIMATFLNSGR
ncbi:MAG: hypothetical protein WC364_06275 [Eubacteriales bacterium]|jgi:dissimilatory sulfite reductase (desulfoviridin) alpha/beta subunit